LVFKVFSIINTENKVKAKYKTKNNTTEVNPVFLETKNQTNASTSSSRNLSVTATRLCNVWLAGSLLCPLKNIINVNNAISMKKAESIITSLKLIAVFVCEKMKYPAARMRISSITSS
jgi:hypothetical protein